jgi:hypothetical protein
MSSLGYKIGSAAWQSASITAAAQATWSIVATMPIGLSTIQFNASDSNTPANNVVSPTYTVLVDTSTPTITDNTTAGSILNQGQLFSATIVVSEGDLNATSVTVSVNGTAISGSAITVTGTNNPGHSVSYGVTAQLPSGNWNVVVSADTLAGLSGSSKSEMVYVVVQTDQSFTVSTDAFQTNFQGNPDSVAIGYLNNLPSTQSATIKAVAYLNNAQVSIGTANIINLGAGQTSTFYVSFLGLTPGQQYTVHIWVVDNGVVASTTTVVNITA